MPRKYTVTIRVNEKTRSILDFVIARRIEEAGKRLSYAEAVEWLASVAAPETIKKAERHLNKVGKTPSPDED